ncbi:MAG: hypothetical protein UX23_C0001G0064 [Parcubacteria group bacterium GW2011_GWB1_45_9]|nr:MAG: hypothetical protein UX23_C0001G0064 [Parcubacteria group bacterium GW2011_GWB1_45_9]
MFTMVRQAHHKMDKIYRCGWPGANEQMIRYHDKEWGTPCHNDKKLFEYIVLDTFQAGLSWAIVLKKRENFRKAFVGFDPNKVVGFSENRLKDLLHNSGIIRNRLKIYGTVANASAFLNIKKEFSSFDKYIWGFVGCKTIVNSPRKASNIASCSKESEAMSKDLKKRGFKFVGPTICYAFMQGIGMVNDHETKCFRYKQLLPGVLK